MILPARLIRIITIIGTNKRQNPFGGLLNNQSFDFCTGLFWQFKKKIHTKATMEFLEKNYARFLENYLYKFFFVLFSVIVFFKQF